MATAKRVMGERCGEKAVDGETCWAHLSGIELARKKLSRNLLCKCELHISVEPNLTWVPQQMTNYILALRARMRQLRHVDRSLLTLS
jgi:hypothetical protein